MARLSYLERDDLPELERDIFDDLLKQRGAIGNRHYPKITSA